MALNMKHQPEVIFFMADGAFFEKISKRVAQNVKCIDIVLNTITTKDSLAPDAMNPLAEITGDQSMVVKSKVRNTTSNP